MSGLSNKRSLPVILSRTSRDIMQIGVCGYPYNIIVILKFDAIVLKSNQHNIIIMLAALTHTHSLACILSLARSLEGAWSQDSDDWYPHCPAVVHL